MIYVLTGLVVLALVYVGCLCWVAVGRQPRGERLARVEHSPHYRNGHFENAEPTVTMTGDAGFFRSMWRFLFGRAADVTPSQPLPHVRADLLHLDRNREVVVWMGHSTVFIQTGGKRFLFDPVLTSKLPAALFMRPFRGAAAFSPADIPDIDVLVITHDHWDHLDYPTVKALQPRVGRVVCALGIGEDFEYWGFPRQKITDVDWGDSVRISSTVTLRCLPTRHFSGRGLTQGKAFWCSYLIDGPRRIFVSGDGGFDGRFRKIGQRYPGIDLAIMENGQYNNDWNQIHTLPRQLPLEIDALGARRVMTYHNSKFALARHPWYEPLDLIWKHAQGKPWQLLTPRIGEMVDLQKQQTFRPWWRAVAGHGK